MYRNRTRKIEQMPKREIYVDRGLMKVYYLVKGTGYLTGNINGFKQILSRGGEGMKKRLLCLIGIVFAAACFTGCQQKDPEPGDIAGYDEGEEYLSIWVHSIEDTEEGQAYKESVESFNEAYDGQYFADIEFVPRNDSGGGYSDKVNASVMAGGLPDVLTVDGPNISAYAANGIIQPLAELTEEEESEYLPSIIEQGTVNDELYALGVMESSVGFYYNKDIIEEAGIEIPDADDPWTWSEFLDILEELKPLMDEKNGYPLDMTFPVGETSIYYFAPFVWSGGGELVSDDGLTVDGYFNMMTVVDVSAADRDFSVYAEDLDKLGEGMGLIIRCQRSEIFEKMHRL